VRLVTSSYFWPRNKDGNHAIQSAAADNPMLHAHLTALCVIDAELFVTEFWHHAEVDLSWHAGICYVYNYCGPWNSLPINIRESHSLPTFRRHLKTFCFQPAYPLSAVHLP